MTGPQLQGPASGGVIAVMLHVCWAEPRAGGGRQTERSVLVCFVFSGCQSEGTKANL